MPTLRRTPWPRMADLRLLPVLCATWLACAVCVLLPDAWLVVAPVGVAGSIALVHQERTEPRRKARHRLQPTGSTRLAAAAACAAASCAAVLAGPCRADFDADPVTAAAGDGGNHVVVARVQDHPRPDARRRDVVRATVRVVAIRGSPRASSARVHASGAALGATQKGDVVRIRGTLRGEGATPPLAAFMNVDVVDVLERPTGWRAGPRVVHGALVQATEGLPDHAQALVPGMSIGADGAMDRGLRDAMRTASLAHLTAVSGTHLAIALGAVARAIPRTGPARVAACLLVLGAFIAVGGPEPSIIRSASMAGVALLGLVISRPGQSMGVLMGVATAMLMVDPWCAVSPGFGMSVLATWGVIGPAQWVATWTRSRIRAETTAGRFVRRVVEIVAVPVCAQLMVCPVLLQMSPWIPTWGVVANVAAAPAVAPACLLSLAAAVCGPWWAWGARALAWAAAPFTWWIAGVAEMVADAPLAQLPWLGGWAGVAAMCAMLAGVGGAFAAGRALWRVVATRKRKAGDGGRRRGRGDTLPP